MHPREHFIQLLDQVSLEAGLRDYQIASALDVGRTYLSQIRSGLKTPSQKLLARLERLGARITQLKGDPTAIDEIIKGGLSPWLPASLEPLREGSSVPLGRSEAEGLAAECGLSLEEFQATVVMRAGRQIARELLAERAAKERERRTKEEWRSLGPGKGMVKEDPKISQVAEALLGQEVEKMKRKKKEDR